MLVFIQSPHISLPILCVLCQAALYHLWPVNQQDGLSDQPGMIEVNQYSRCCIISRRRKGGRKEGGRSGKEGRKEERIGMMGPLYTYKYPPPKYSCSTYYNYLSLDPISDAGEQRPLCAPPLTSGLPPLKSGKCAVAHGCLVVIMRDIPHKNTIKKQISWSYAYISCVSVCHPHVPMMKDIRHPFLEPLFPGNVHDSSKSKSPMSR